MKFLKAAVIFCVSLILLTRYLDRPAQLIFDEKFYVPAAKSLLENGTDTNFQHPPLAKEMTAAGIAALGDNPWGWRVASALMGAFTLVSLYYLGLLFANSFYATVFVILVFTNGLFFNLSRLALLEIFSLGFAIFAVTVLFYRLFKNSKPGLFELALPGILFGLAIAAKWSALVPFAVGFAGGVGMRRYRASQWGVFVASAAVFYFLPFALLGNSSGFFDLQAAMWSFHRPEVYQPDLPMENTSQWWEWPLKLQPMWFAVLPNSLKEPGKFLGVMIFGNPFVLWTGWAALLACLKANTTKSRWITALALTPLLFWAIAQRPVTYYYYFLPTSVFLALALVYSVSVATEENLLTKKRAQTILVGWALLSVIYFFYHWPLMTGAELTAAEFHQRYPFWSF